MGLQKHIILKWTKILKQLNNYITLLPIFYMCIIHTVNIKIKIYFNNYCSVLSIHVKKCYVMLKNMDNFPSLILFTTFNVNLLSEKFV